MATSKQSPRATHGEGASPTPTPPIQRRRSQVLLACGALVGLVVATLGLLEDVPAAAAELPDDVVAMVNGAPIQRAAFERALAAVRTDRRDARVPDELRRHVLDRLIEEELLVQRGIELGLAERDRRVRADLTAAVMDLVIARGETNSEATIAELRSFHQEQADHFRLAPQLRIELLSFRAAGALARAEQARRRLTAGEPVAALQELADPPTVPLPAGWLPLRKIEDYVGPTAARAAAELEEGATSEPLHTPDGILLVVLVARRPGRVPPFDQIREQVRSEWLKRAGDERLRSFLAERRAAADVTIVEGTL